MTVAELGYRFIMNLNQGEGDGVKIKEMYFPPADIESISGFLGKQYRLINIITKEQYILDLQNAAVTANALTFKKGKPIFYKVKL
jgi:hypothetical protein